MKNETKDNGMPSPNFLTVLVHVLPLWAALKKGALFPVGGLVLASLTRSPLQGASVKVKGRNTAVQTNPKGRFSLHLEEVPATLEFSYQGFIKQEITVSPPLEVPLLITLTNYRLVAGHEPDHMYNT